MAKMYKGQEAEEKNESMKVKMKEGPKDREIPTAKRVSKTAKQSSKVRNESKGASSKGVGGGLRATAMKEEPIAHKSAYRGRNDKKVETGLPRQEASFRNRDRQGSGLENEPTFQRKLKSYPNRFSVKDGENNED